MLIKKSVLISNKTPEFLEYISNIPTTYKTFPKTEKEIQKSKDLFLKHLENFRKLDPQEKFSLIAHIQLLEVESCFRKIAELYHQILNLKIKLEKSEDIYIDCSIADEDVSEVHLATKTVIDFSLLCDLNSLLKKYPLLSFNTIDYGDIELLYKKQKNNSLRQTMLIIKSAILQNQLIEQFESFTLSITQSYSEQFKKRFDKEAFGNYYLLPRLLAFMNEFIYMMDFFQQKQVFYPIYDGYYQAVEDVGNKYFQSKDFNIIPQLLSETKRTLYTHYCQNLCNPPYQSLISQVLKNEFNINAQKAIASANQLIASGSRHKGLQKKRIAPMDDSLPLPTKSDKGKEKEQFVQITETLAATSLSPKTSQIEKILDKLSEKAHQQHWTKELPRIRRFEKLIGLDKYQFREKALSFTDHGKLRYLPTVGDSELSHDFYCHSFPFVEFLIDHPKTFQQIIGGYFAYAQLITSQGDTLNGVIEIGINKEEKVLIHRYFKPFDKENDSLKQLFPTSIDIQSTHGSQTIFEAPEEPHQTTWSNLHFSLINDQVLSIQDKDTHLTLQVFI